jgi:hypothetical protein
MIALIFGVLFAVSFLGFVKRDKQRHYAGLEYYGKTVDMSWFKRKPYDIKQNRKGDD